MAATWYSTDRRDPELRAFVVYDFGGVGKINGAFVTILCLIAQPRFDRSVDPILVDRVVSRDVRSHARAYAELAGGGLLLDADGHPDANHTANVRTRIAIVERSHGAVKLRLAVHRTRQRVPGRRRPLTLPTDVMLERVRTRLREDGDGHFRWESATSADELPVAPHDPATLSIVGVDSRGRLHDVVKPDFAGLDHHRGRDLRRLAQAVVGHESFLGTFMFCQARGLTPLFVWRMKERVAA